MPLLVAFVDFTAFQKTSLRKHDAEIAEALAEYYALVEDRVDRAGGVVIKFMGDAALIAFEAPAADAGVMALIELKTEVDRWLMTRGWPASELIVKAHFGEVICGPFGKQRRIDIIGNVVNTAATLPSKSFALSAELFRALAKETRTRFKKHTPPITYIRTEDRH
jgi:class 3 adenylate cyclase